MSPSLTVSAARIPAFEVTMASNFTLGCTTRISIRVAGGAADRLDMSVSKPSVKRWPREPDCFDVATATATFDGLDSDSGEGLYHADLVIDRAGRWSWQVGLYDVAGDAPHRVWSLIDSAQGSFNVDAPQIGALPVSIVE